MHLLGTAMREKESKDPMFHGGGRSRGGKIAALSARGMGRGVTTSRELRISWLGSVEVELRCAEGYCAVADSLLK